MAIPYVITQRKNPSKPLEAAKFYGTYKQYGQVPLESLSEIIASRCTVQKADVEAVILALYPTIRRLLLDSYSIKLKELGLFRITVKAIGTATKEEFTSAFFERINFRFIPLGRIKKRMALNSAEVSFTPWVSKNIANALAKGGGEA